MKRTHLSALFLSAWISTLVISCFQPAHPPQQAMPHLPLPTKDEMALVNGEPLTIRGYLDIRAITPSLTPEKSLWAGIAALALYSEAKHKGYILDRNHALKIARYALEDLASDAVAPELTAYYRTGLSRLSPARIKLELEELLARSVVVKSSLNLSQVF